MKSAQQGAATSVWAATAPQLEGASGAYLLDCKVRAAGDHSVRSRRSRATAGARRGWQRQREQALQFSSPSHPLSLPPSPCTPTQVATPSKGGRDADMAQRLWAKTEELLAAALAKAGLPADS